MAKGNPKTCALDGCTATFVPVTCQKYCTPEHRRMAKKCTGCGAAIPDAPTNRTLCHPCGAERARFARANPEHADAVMSRYRTKTYGLDTSEYLALVAAQGNCCAICGQPETATRRGRLRTLCVDHDHTTGAVRALLCSRCNTAVGLMLDDAERLRAAADYLDLHSRKQETTCASISPVR